MANQNTAPKKKAVIYLLKDRFEYYDEAQSSIFQFPFQPNVVSDLEVLDYDLLSSQIKSFIEANKLAPAHIFFVVSPFIIFEKTFAKSTPEDKNEQTKNYLDAVPFEHVIYKVFDLAQGGYNVVAINGELFEFIKKAFDQFQFVTQGIVPQSILDGRHLNKQQLDADMANFVCSNFDQLSKQNFNKEESDKSDQSNQSMLSNAESDANKKKPPRQTVLIGVFVFLFLILIAVILLQTFQKPPLTR